MIVETYMTYQFIKRYITPFKRWKAYELGIIDENGNILRKRSTLVTEEERAAFGTFDLLVLNIKKMTFSSNNVLIPSAVSALLMREDRTMEQTAELAAAILEDGDAAGIPTNNIGGGAIQGAGVGPKGEPGKRDFRKIKKILSRKVP